MLVAACIAVGMAMVGRVTNNGQREEVSDLQREADVTTAHFVATVVNTQLEYAMDRDVGIDRSSPRKLVESLKAHKLLDPSSEEMFAAVEGRFYITRQGTLGSR